MQRGSKRLAFSQLKVGIVVFVSIIVLTVMLMTATGGIGQLFSKPFLVKTRFAQVDGLLPGHEVRLAGKRVGNVEEVNFFTVPERAEDPNTVEVIMSVDPEIAGQWIRDDSRATLGSIGLLGDKVVEISPGTKDGRPLKSGSYIEGTAESNIRKIISGVDPLISDLADTANQIKTMVVKVNQGEGTIGQLLNNPGAYEKLDSILLETRKLVREVHDGEGTLGRLLTDPSLYDNLRDATARLEKVTREIDEGSGTVSRLIREPELYDKLDNMMSVLQETVNRVDIVTARIERGEGTIGRLINDPTLHDDTREMMASLRNITARLDKGEGTAGALLHDRELYDNLNALSSHMVRLMYDFRQDPKKFLRFKVSIF